MRKLFLILVVGAGGYYYAKTHNMMPPGVGPEVPSLASLQSSAVPMVMGLMSGQSPTTALATATGAHHVAASRRGLPGGMTDISDGAAPAAGQGGAGDQLSAVAKAIR